MQPVDPAFSDALANLTKGATNAAETVLNLFDSGFQVYAGVAERVNAIKKINSEISAPVSSTVPQKASEALNSFETFIKSEKGLLTVGAVSVLVLALVFSRG